ncbi:DUF4097 family beta strand repeat-containing protein [Vagococcus vulneris]|uniref:DUF4097 domain-containing protein n=1 Tax=Vagococcus vulneris TaxID=1977869 RepID=A0A429ZSE2_9ENTE|nr:DUF4097 family beta strand repeat-containing protein [Vagococcus vulneris]RST96549.1 hypothetical protein CBF37_11055 [Vagococcus vulneris]
MMKKKTIFLIIFSFCLIIVGSIGAIAFNIRLDKIENQTKLSKSYTYDQSKTLTINANELKNISVSSSKDDKVHLNYRNRSKNPDNQVLVDWKADKRKDETILNISQTSRTKKKQIRLFNFDFTDYYEDQPSISVPYNYEKIIIRGKKLNTYIYDFKGKDLSVNVQSGSVSIDSTSAKNITVKNKSGHTDLTNVSASQTIDLNSNSGHVGINDSKAANLILKTINGEIFTANTTGKINGNSTHGPISVNHEAGGADLSTETGDILFHTNLTEKADPITLNSDHGNINLEIPEKEFNRLPVRLETEHGKLSDIFNKKLTSQNLYESGTEKPILTVKTKNGTIDAQSIDDNDDHFGDDQGDND